MEQVNVIVAKMRSFANNLLGVEGFYGDASGNTVIDTTALARAASAIFLYSIFALVVYLAFGLGAARLSYCYSMYSGNDTVTAILFAALAFFFPGIYYPFYALLLNPVCGMARRNKGVMGSLIGGRRDHRG